MSRALGFAVVLSAVVLGGAPPAAHAAPITYFTTLSGPAEAPPNNSPATGITIVDFDPVAHTMRVRVTFSGLTGPTTVAHIHGPTAVPGAGTAGVMTATPTFPGFPAGVTSGSYDVTFNTLAAGTYNPAFVTANGGTLAGAESALFSAISSGRAYMNVHSSAFPGGEIRGFLLATPEPVSLLTFGGVVGVVGLLRVRGRAVR